MCRVKPLPPKRSQPPVLQLAIPTTRWTVWSTAVVGGLALAAACLAAAPVADGAVLGDLARGQWMVAAGQVLRHNIYSVSGQSEWLNREWLWQVTSYGVYSAGGFVGLSLLRIILVAAAAALVAYPAIRRMPPAAVGAAALLLLLTVWTSGWLSSRLLAMALAAAMAFLLEQARLTGRTVWLWPAPAVLLVWVNADGTWLLGLGMLWWSVGAGLALASRRPQADGLVFATREAVATALAGLFTCLLTPWLVQGVLSISSDAGWGGAARGAMAEAGLPAMEWAWAEPAVAAPAAVLLVLAATALGLNVRKAPLAHGWWWLHALMIALGPRANLPVSAAVWAALLAIHGGGLLRRLKSTRPGRGRIAGPVGSMVVAAACVGIAIAALAGWLRRPAQSGGSGLGLAEGALPMGAGRLLADLPAAGDVYCLRLSDAGVFNWFALPRLQPNRRVFVDATGPLHTAQDLQAQLDLARQLRQGAASRVEGPASLRFFYIPHDDLDALQATSASLQFDLLHIEPAGVLFARADWQHGFAGQKVVDRLPARPGHPARPASNLAEYDSPLADDGVEGPLPRSRSSFLGGPRRDLHVQLGAALLAVADGGSRRADFARDGDRETEWAAVLAIRHFATSLMDAPGEPTRALLARAHQTRARQQALLAGDAAQPGVDLHLARAIYLYRRLVLKAPLSEAAIASRVGYAHALRQANRLEEALQIVEGLFADLPAATRLNPPDSLASLRNALREATAEAIRDSRARSVTSLATAAQARALSGQLRLGQRAVDLLKAQGGPDDALLLGDLLLQAGMPEEALAVYGRIGASHADAPRKPLRAAMARWVLGQYVTAARELATLCDGADATAETRLQAAVALETQGDYRRAIRCLDERGPDQVMDRTAALLRARLGRVAAR